MFGVGLTRNLQFGTSLNKKVTKLDLMPLPLPALRLWGGGEGWRTQRESRRLWKEGNVNEYS